MSNVVDNAIVVALDSLLEYAKYLSDCGQLNYDLLEKRVSTFKKEVGDE